MLAWIGQKDLLEVWRANCEHDFVTVQQLAITGNRAVDQIATIKKRLKTCREIFGKFQFIPAERELFHVRELINDEIECFVIIGGFNVWDARTEKLEWSNFIQSKTKLIADKLIRLIIQLSSSSCYSPPISILYTFLHKQHTKKKIPSDNDELAAKIFLSRLISAHDPNRIDL